MIDDILAKLSKAIQIELLENTLQKPLTESEKARIQKFLKDELKKHTSQGKRTDLSTSSKNLEKVKHGVLEQIGTLFNESHEQVRKRLVIAEKAEQFPEKFGDIPARIDNGLSIEHAHKIITVAEKAETPTPNLPQDEFDLIYADFPWKYDLALQGSPEYKTLANEEIKKEIPKLPAHKTCILFMWATYPKIIDAIDLIDFYGFTYKSQIVWVKTKDKKLFYEDDIDNTKLQIGTGYYVRGSHELLLIAIKGSPGVPPEHARVPSVVFAPRTTHSAKPPIFRKIINDMYSGKKKLEMFNRTKDEHHNNTWTYWGDESQ